MKPTLHSFNYERTGKQNHSLNESATFLIGHDPGRHRNMTQNKDLIIFLKKIVLKSLRVAIFAKMAAKIIENSM